MGDANGFISICRQVETIQTIKYIMNEIRKPFTEVLSKEQIHNLYVKCREANRQFNDMMNDFDAWGNID